MYRFTIKFHLILAGHFLLLFTRKWPEKRPQQVQFQKIFSLRGDSLRPPLNPPGKVVAVTISTGYIFLRPPLLKFLDPPLLEMVLHKRDYSMHSISMGPQPLPMSQAVISSATTDAARILQPFKNLTKKRNRLDTRYLPQNLALPRCYPCCMQAPTNSYLQVEENSPTNWQNGQWRNLESSGMITMGSQYGD